MLMVMFGVDIFVSKWMDRLNVEGSCGKTNFRRRRQFFPLVFFYHVGLDSCSQTLKTAPYDFSHVDCIASERV